ncbi:MAG TPA: hypothetical protein VMS40_14890 [Vicinamibacterales bacterium]|nr:hypothetical protein [Vicinamibacterales bacterium]
MKDDLRDPMLELLARLPPSAARAEFVRARSLLALEKRRQKRNATRDSKSAGRVVDGALYFACVVYIAAAAIEALKLGWPLR